MRNFRLRIEYDGTRFKGWQIQKGQRTVQQALRRAIRKATGESVTVIGASRTDAGVHARGQIANFLSSTRIPVERLAQAVNYYLPEDVAVREAREVPIGFHSQRDAVAKTYRYTWLNAWTPGPLLRDRAVLVRGDLSVPDMRKAARVFVGRHDFRAFASEAERAKTTVRTIHSAVVRRRGEIVELDLIGNAFLYNMVRCIAGTVLRAGQGRIPIAEAGRILREGDRKAAGPVAPARGLCLVRVHVSPRRRA